MNPHQKNKIDVSSLTPDEQKAFRLFGRLPSKSQHLANKINERKYWDSGDYYGNKTASADVGSVGSEHPVPENIPHLSSPVNFNGADSSGIINNLRAANLNQQVSKSPVKEGSFLNRELSADDTTAAATEQDEKNDAADGVQGGGKTESIPIRK